MVLALPLLLAHCSGSVGTSPGPDAATPADVAALPDAVAPTDTGPRPDAAPLTTPSCAEVRATCGQSPALVVRAHAEGVTGLDGARALFVVRYVLRTGEGLEVPRGLALGRGLIQNGAFETCLCVPTGASWYPKIATVVFTPGTTGETARDVARASFAQLFAVTADQDLSFGSPNPSAEEVEAALAATVDRTSTVTVHGTESTVGSARVFGGLVADEHAVAAEISTAAIADGALRFRWFMPGRQWPSERLVLLVDRNNDHRCNDGDQGAIVTLAGREQLDGVPAWLEGSALTTVCDALRVEVVRGE
jgi:hypothetical protein